MSAVGEVGKVGLEFVDVLAKLAGEQVLIGGRVIEEELQPFESKLGVRRIARSIELEQNFQQEPVADFMPLVGHRAHISLKNAWVPLMIGDNASGNFEFSVFRYAQTERLPVYWRCEESNLAAGAKPRIKFRRGCVLQNRIDCWSG